MKQSIMAVALTLCLTAQAKSGRETVSDFLLPANSEILKGYVGVQLSKVYDNGVCMQDVDRLVSPFLKRTETHLWQGEFWGKWMCSAVIAYQYKPSRALMNMMREAVDKLVATQTADGYIGNYAPEAHLKEWDIWGRKYCMLGLLNYYGLTKDKKALIAAEKEADYLMGELKNKNVSIASLGNHRGMAASSILKPFCYLYSFTGKKQYLVFAENIVKDWETADGPQLLSKAEVAVGQRFPKPDANDWYNWKQGQKAYEMMACYEGLAELYRLTGNTQYLTAVKNTWQSIMDTEINVTGSGSAMEAWFGGKAIQYAPIKHYQETCVTATWIKLSRQLLLLTGDSKYADAIEQTFYNALMGAMRKNGASWAKYTPLSGQRLPGSQQCNMGLNCCEASGPRGLFAIPDITVMQNKRGATICFYIPGEYHITSPRGQKVTLTQEGNYEKQGEIQTSLKIPRDEEMTLSFRIPAWSTSTDVRVKNDIVKGVRCGEFLNITRKWKDGDVVSLKFDMQPRVSRIGSIPEYVAICRGPIVLARDSRLAGPDLEAVVTPCFNKEGKLELIPVAIDNPEIGMVFKGKFMPESYKEEGDSPVDVELCDYASAGNASASLPFFKVWMPQLYNPQKK